MSQEILIERLFEALISGDRGGARAIVAEALGGGAAAEQALTELFWPTYERIEKMHRADQMTTLSHHLATRLLRVLADQTALRLERAGSRERDVFAVAGPTDADELAAQIATDLLEAKGFDVTYAGGGIAVDEILAKVQEARPDVLLLFASAPSDLPSIRWLIDTMREIGACDGVQVVVGGGVFNRAEGLAEEIGADLWAEAPSELVEVMLEAPERRAPADQRTVGRHKKKRVA